MSNLFAISYCRMPLQSLEEEDLASKICDFVTGFDLDHFGRWWELQGDYLLELASEMLALEDYSVNALSQSHWSEIVKWLIARELFGLAKEVFLFYSDDITYLKLDDVTWAFSGGEQDNIDNNEVCRALDTIRGIGLDHFLFKNCK
jgi:hypothetical protein